MLSPYPETALILGSFSLSPNKFLWNFATMSFAKNLFFFKSKKPVLKKKSSLLFFLLFVIAVTRSGARNGRADQRVKIPSDARCGAFAMAEKPEEYATILTDFLDQIGHISL